MGAFNNEKLERGITEDLRDRTHINYDKLSDYYIEHLVVTLRKINPKLADYCQELADRELTWDKLLNELWNTQPHVELIYNAGPEEIKGSQRIKTELSEAYGGRNAKCDNDSIRDIIEELTKRIQNGKPINKSRLKEEDYPFFDHKKCIRCYCCQELCPSNAIELKTPFLGRFVK